MKMLRWVPFILWFCSSLANADEERIMAIQLSDGTMVSEGIFSIQKDGRLLVPIVSFFDAIGVQTELDLSSGKLTGFYVDPDNRYNLNIKNGELTFRGKKSQLKPSSIELKLAEVYIDIAELQNHLPFSVKVLFFKSLIIVDSDIVLPAISRKLREMRQRSQQKNLKFQFKNYVPPPNQKGYGFLFDQNLSYQFRKSDPQLFIQSLASAEKNDFEVLMSHGMTQDESAYERLTLSQKKLNGAMAGVLRLKEWSAFDVLIPSRPLLHDLHWARGLYVSSFDIGTQTRFDRRDFQGELKEGWEVELYRNSQLLSRQSIGTRGEYLFKDVLLSTGMNHFQLRFYGPAGERRTEDSFEYIDPRLQKSARWQYQITSGQLEDKSLLSSAHLHLPIWKNLSMGVSALHSKHPESEESGYTADLSVGVGALFLQMQGAQTQDQARAGRFFSRWQSLRSAVQYEVERYDEGFQLKHLESKSESVVERDSLRFDTSVRLGVPVQTHVERKRQFAKFGLIEDSAEWGLGIYAYQLFFRHLFSYDSIQEDWQGTIDIQKLLLAHSYRFEAGYDEAEVFSSAMEYAYTWPKRHSLRLRYGYRFDEKISTWNLSARKDFRYVYASLGLQAESGNDPTLLAQAGYSFAYQSQHGISFASEAMAPSSAATVLVFKDTNGNGLRDEGEAPVADVNMMVNGRPFALPTDESGRVLISPLPLHQKVHLGLDIGSLKDPLWQPKEPGIHFVSKTGRLLVYDLAIIETSEVDGVLSFGGDWKGKPRGGFQILMSNKQGLVISKTRTQSNGFYVLDKIPSGTFRIYVDPVALKALNLVAKPEVIEVDTSVKAGFLSDYHFELSPRVK